MLSIADRKECRHFFSKASTCLYSSLSCGCVLCSHVEMVSQNENTHCSSSLSFTPRRFCKSSEKAQGLSSTCLRGNGCLKMMHTCCIPQKKLPVLICIDSGNDDCWFTRRFKGAKFQTSPNHTNHNHKDIRISSDFLKKLPGLWFFRDAEGIAWAFSGASHGVYDASYIYIHGHDINGFEQIWLDIERYKQMSDR